MKKHLLVLLCLIISGCVIFNANRKSEKELLKQQIAELQKILANKDTEIENLQKSIGEKDLIIKNLKDKLNTFGVFE